MKKTTSYGATILVTLSCFVACTKETANKPSTKDYSTEVVKMLPDDQVILEYDGGRVSVAEVKERVKPEFEKAREAILNAYLRAAEDLVQQREDQGQSQFEVSKSEAEQYIKANKITQSSIEEIRKFLVAEKRRVQGQVAKHELFRRLNVKNKLGAARYDVTKTKNMPTLGSESAPVTVQIFCDLMSPLCVRSRMFMKQIETSNPGQVRFVYRFFPIASHPFSREAALLGICAHEKDAFWKFHDVVLDQQRSMNLEKMEKTLKEIGLDVSDAKSCMQSTETAKTLQFDLDEATSLGLNQAPTYFINGTKLTDPEKAFDFTLAEIKSKH